MYQLRVSVLLLMLLVLLPCLTAAPSHRYFSPSSPSEQDHALPNSGWLAPRIISNPLLSLMGTRVDRGLTAMNTHRIEKRRCNTATCVTQRLADFLVRSSNIIGTVYTPTNVGSATYGKRELLQLPNYWHH
ncbi:islet amyloid polypeptide [Mastacembelus armatus]|uniref:Islet amyloid polypeptide n=1 Tax=Mastacembelus armatus TaxID=205130 RepID=A0A3Q3RLC6_9TELE|nr:islet amyloid polypeptide [Mastacembelus armatus]